MSNQLENIDETITIGSKTGQYTGSAYPISIGPSYYSIVGYEPHGKGIMRYSDGTVYEGQWEHSNYSGTGTYTSKDEEYVGSWVNGIKSGHGKLTTGNGLFVYDGWFVNDQRSGTGTRKCLESGVSYTGQWSKDVPSGKGTWHWADGSWWESKWKGSDGKTATGSGRTRRLFSNGAIYEGETTDHAMTGMGKITYLTGEVYRGKVRNSKKHGQGSVKTLDGLLYEGKWVNDSKSGKFKVTDLVKGKVKNRYY
ncbi:hypothetical protein GGI43DRAFT_394624 [Trichoderma evansii]